MLPIHNEIETFWGPQVKRQIQSAKHQIRNGNYQLAVDFLDSAQGCINTIERINKEREKYEATKG